MPQADQLGRKMRKQVAKFRSQLARKKIHTKTDLDAMTRDMHPEDYKRIAGLIPHVFPAARPS